MLPGNRVHFIIKCNLRREQPQEWLAEIRDVCTDIRTPREGKKEYIGQTFRDISYYIPDSPSKSERKQKSVGIRTIYDITERTCDHDGQYYVIPKVECDMYSINVDFRDADDGAGIAAAGGHPHEKACQTPEAAHGIGAYHHDTGRCDEVCKKNRRRPWPEQFMEKCGCPAVGKVP